MTTCHKYSQKCAKATEHHLRVPELWTMSNIVYLVAHFSMRHFLYATLFKTISGNVVNVMFNTHIFILFQDTYLIILLLSMKPYPFNILI